MDVIKFAKLSYDAFTPTKADPDAAGFDLYAAESTKISTNSLATVRTDIQLELPPNCYGRLAPRSGLALHHSISIFGGVIDRNYQGNVVVLLFNHDSNNDFHVEKGHRIAQLIPEMILNCRLQEVESIDFETSQRKDKGFGSSGL